MIFFALPPLLCAVGFTASSVFSSRVAAPNYSATEVLNKPNNCGYIDFSMVQKPTDFQFIINQTRSYYSMVDQAAHSARDYARGCYGSGRRDTSSCGIYPVQHLPYTTKVNAACPFASGRCILGQQTAFELSTPWLDSHIHFGMNAPPQNRVQWRKVSTCSVLDIKNLTVTSKVSTGETFYYYTLGAQPQRNGSTAPFTFAASDFAKNSQTGYSIWSPLPAIYGASERSGWLPIPDFNISNADVSVFFLNANSMIFYAPVDDPFFSAHRSAPNDYLGVAAYNADDLVRALACTDTFALRNPNTNVSSPLTGVVTGTANAATLEFNRAQLTTANRLTTPAWFAQIWAGVAGMQAGSLRAQNIVSGIQSPGLPSNQWQIEVSGWFETVLANMQEGVLAYQDKDISAYEGYAKLSLPPDFEQAMFQCNNQIVRNIGGYQSFSVLGIGIIAIVGVVIIVVSLVLDSVVGFCQKHWGRENRGLAKRRAWIRDNVLQIQRHAFESQGSGGQWRKRWGAVPITRREAQPWAWFYREGDDQGSISDSQTRLLRSPS